MVGWFEKSSDIVRRSPYIAFEEAEDIRVKAETIVTARVERLSEQERQVIRSVVKCPFVDQRVDSLADYLAVTTSQLADQQVYWFRGQADMSWPLLPSALRYGTRGERERALALLEDFKRVAEMKLPRPPRSDERLRWLQLAQHYGIPTRLLDWTESALFALYFACMDATHDENHGIVYLMNPNHLSVSPGRTKKSTLQPTVASALVDKYSSLGPSERRNGLPTIAVKPVWNSERLMLQRGVFTLHGSMRFELDKSQCPSLVGIPIAPTSKPRLRRELDRIGIDEMTLFPELEYTCTSLKRRAGLPGKC